MTENQQKWLYFLAVQLRVLRKQEQNKYLHCLDQFAEEVHQSFDKRMDFRTPNALAARIYVALEGSPLNLPQYPAPSTKEENQKQQKFDSIWGGIIAYAHASDKDKEAFKNSVFKFPNPLAQIAHWIKICRN